MEYKEKEDDDFRTSTDEMSIFTGLEEDKSSRTSDSLSNEEAVLQESKAMQNMYQRIARQKMVVMKCLDENSPCKQELNKQIVTLQELQKQQIELEIALLEHQKKNQNQLKSERLESDVESEAPVRRVSRGYSSVHLTVNLN